MLGLDHRLFMWVADKCTLILTEGDSAKALAKLERLQEEELVEKPFQRKQMKIRFPEHGRSGRSVVTINNLEFGFGDKVLFNKANLTIERGEKLAIIGPNGCGKSTLPKLIMDLEKPRGGEVLLGEHNVLPNYFEQNQVEALHLNKTVLETVVEAVEDWRSDDIKGLLGRCNFKADMLDRKVSLLSGGEKMKVGDRIETVHFFHCYKRGVDRVFVDHPMFLEKVWGKTGSKIYGPRTGLDYKDNQLRFSLFCQAALEAPRVLNLKSSEHFSGPYGEDVVFIANDWHTALLPCYLKTMYKSRGLYKNAKVAFCIHNIAYQGRFSFEDFSLLNLPDQFKSSFDFFDGYEKPVKGRKINWMKESWGAYHEPSWNES
ncbi:uncharacterized protein LOC126708394 [Quercus robur]|uniref:uncharacterized protein LOC126708394 n=1 Tax=Quercus robur TaxID=38942 RepID=UPI002163D0D1|nr:uncharacterized protein LOC126708394 [Quercus robur]